MFKNIQNITIKTKLVAIILTVNILTTFITLLVVATLDFSNKKSELIDNGLLQAKLIAQYAKVSLDFSDTLWANHVLAQLSDLKDVKKCQIFNDKNEVFASYKSDSTYSSDFTLNNINGNDIYDGIVIIKQPVINNGKYLGAILLEKSTSSLIKAYKNLSWTLFMILIFIIIIGYFIALYFQKYLSKPIEDLAISVRHISKKHDYKMKEFNYPWDDEIGVLYNEFRNMVNGIRERDIKLKTAKEYLTDLIDSMPSILVGINSDGLITSLNSHGEVYLKMSRYEMIDQSADKIFTHFSTFINEASSILSTGKPKLFSNIKIKTGKDINWYDLTVYPLTSGKEAVIRIDNITHAHDLEVQINQTHRMDVIGQLAGGVAHDFNNMLSGIMGASELLSISQKDNDPSELELLDIIIKSCERASDLTSKLLTFSRKGHNDQKNIDISLVIKDSIEILNHSLDKKVSIIFENNAEKYTVLGDKSDLQNSFMNLGINAGHAMKNGGTLTYKSQNRYLDTIYCKSLPFDIDAGQYIEIEISDTGSGMSLDIINRIFEPFFTTKDSGEGTGLGLAAVYGTVKNHGGAITVYSELDVGTVFRIFLPIVNNDNNSDTDTKQDNIISGTGTVLLIDDEPIVRTSSELMLKKLGYTVLTAKDGLEGVEIFKINRDIIDIVISDMIMPELNGAETFRAIREIRSDIPFILSSGFTKDENLNQLKSEGVMGFLPKPYSLKYLSKILSENINK